MKNERFLTHTDAHAIANLTESLLRVADTEDNAGEHLLDLLTTASILPPDAEPENVVALRSRVTYVDQASRSPYTVTIVLPLESDLSQGRISILTPVALALLGCKAGDLVSAPLPFGRIQTLRIVEVRREPMDRSL